MVRRERLANNAETTLASAISPSDTSISVADASKFPTEGDFRIAIENEIVLATSVAGTTFTVVRGVENTTPANHAEDTAIAQVITAEGMQRLIGEASDPMSFDRPPFRLVDASGNTLTKSDFTELTTTNTTITDNAGGSISMRHLAPSATERLPRLVRTLTPPFLVRGAYVVTAVSVSTQKGPIAGPLLRDSVNDGQLVQRWRSLDDETLRLRVNYHNAEAFSSGVGSFLRAEPVSSSIVWFEVENDDTDLFFRWSGDGVNFIEWFTEAKANTLTAAPTQAGISIIVPNVTLYEGIVTLVAWDEGAV